MIEVPTKGGQALLDAFVKYVDPATYDGTEAGLCLIGQTYNGLWDELTEDEQENYHADALAQRFGVPVVMVDDIYGGVTNEPMASDFNEAMKYAAQVLNQEVGRMAR